MLDKDSLSILDLFKKNTIEVENQEPKKESRQLNPAPILPQIGNVGDLKQWTNS